MQRGRFGGAGWLVREGGQPVPLAAERMGALGRGPVGAG